MSDKSPDVIFRAEKAGMQPLALDQERVIGGSFCDDAKSSSGSADPPARVLELAGCLCELVCVHAWTSREGTFDGTDRAGP